METPKSKSKGTGAKPVPPPLKAPSQPVSAQPAAVPTKVPPLFRKIDWITMLIAFGVVWVVYFLTLAPEVTLEDSGELCTGAFYAGIPHPPGYPFWSIYSWVWTELLRIGNVAWRVEVGECTAAAAGCALVALIVSRGSSMLMEGIEEFKGIAKNTENLICLVSGAATGIMLGLGYGMWSESVAINRISLFGVPWVMLVMLCLMRWVYAPKQFRYLYFGMFIFGICSTIHQTLLCAGVGIQICIAFANRRLARMMFLCGGSMIFGIILLKQSSADQLARELLQIFAAVGIIQLASYIVLAIITKERIEEFGLDLSIAAVIFFGVEYSLHHGLYALLLAAAVISFVAFAIITWKRGHEWLPVAACGALVMLGASFYLYEAISGMTNPPMEWAYPRTYDGWLHALSRGQYDKAHPTDILGPPERYIMQFGLLASGIAEEFNWVVLVLALVPLFYLAKMRMRERGWIIGVGAVYMCVGVLLVFLMNPSDDKQSVDLHRVFFTSSHAVIGILIGYGLALTFALMATNYQKFRTIALWAGGVLILPGLMCLHAGLSRTFFAGAALENYNHRFVLFLALAGAFVLACYAGRTLLQARESQEVTGSDPKMIASSFLAGAGVCLLIAAYFAFLDRSLNSVSLSAGTVFATLPKALALKIANLPALAGLLILGISVLFVVTLAFRRNKAPLTITFGLLALMPLASGFSNWALCEQRGHWFGYWFGHDMFTPPFKAADGKLSYDANLRAQAMQGANGRLVYPEMTPGTILYGGTDPGRFCPTYMIFCESFIPHKDQPEQDQHFDRRDVYIITQNALADDTYMEYIRAQYDRSQQIDPPFFQEALRSTEEKQLNYETNALARLAFQLLDKPLTAFGAKVEARRRAEGVYPPKEIYIPNGDDMSRSYREYMDEAQRRLNRGQLKQGEIAITNPDGRVAISGQTSVMEINGLLTKVIFDHNPTNDFYVEESFPLDWMFPYLAPYGVIMHINRHELSEVTQDMVDRDHEFWSDYSERLSGNWIKYETSVKEVTDFVDKVYIQHDFSGFNGNRRFIRDEQAQKSFSKLRTAIAGIYAWRLGMLVGTPTPERFIARNPEEVARMKKEADFAYRQAFVFCPFSPEVVYRYVQFLANDGRYEDARRIAETALKFDPNNGGIADIVQKLTPAGVPVSSTPAEAEPPNLSKLEQAVHDHPNDPQGALQLAAAYIQARQPQKAPPLLDQILTNDKADASVVSMAAGLFNHLNDFAGMERAVKRLTQIQPNNPEPWFDLAKIQVIQGQQKDGLQSLSRAVQESDARLATNPGANNLRTLAASDPYFAAVSNSPDFQKIIHPAK